MMMMIVSGRHGPAGIRLTFYIIFFIMISSSYQFRIERDSRVNQHRSWRGMTKQTK